MHNVSVCFLQPFAVSGLEMAEQDLLAQLKKTKIPPKKEYSQNTTLTYPYVESKGLLYDVTQGDIAGNAICVMTIVSVGDCFPGHVKIEQRNRNPYLAEKAFKDHGQLPSSTFLRCLHKEVAADLMATTCNDLLSSNVDVVCICIDSPSLQRPRKYYLQQIADLFKVSESPVGKLTSCCGFVKLIIMVSLPQTVAINYLGHSEKGTGNWCFCDGTISYSDIVDLYRKHCQGKLLTVQSDCCYSGQWVLDCAKTLDSLGVPPCGHRAQERGVLLRVFASCQPDQKAAEPGYSMEAMGVGEDGLAVGQAMSFGNQKSSWFSGTKLVCCHSPDSPCPSNAFSELKWMDGVRGHLPIKMVVKKEKGKDFWSYLMLKDASKKTAQAFEAEVKKIPSTKLGKWGFVLREGEGMEPPDDIKQEIKVWTTLYLT